MRFKILNVCTDLNISNNVTPIQPTALDTLLGSDSKEDIDEFTRYLSESQINHNLDPNNWWMEHEKRNLRIALLAKQILSIPASSASSERVFSSAGNLITSKRSTLDPLNTSALVFKINLLYNDISQ